MKTYTVKEISELLDKNPETVRRWIRSGKLGAVQESRKGGNLVTEQMLSDFLNATPKYSKNSSAFFTGVAAASIVVLGSIIAKKVSNTDSVKNTQITEEQMNRVLEKEIADRQIAIKKKRENIQIIEKEIEEELRNIEILKTIVAENLKKEEVTNEQ